MPSKELHRFVEKGCLILQEENTLVWSQIETQSSILSGISVLLRTWHTGLINQCLAVESILKSFLGFGTTGSRKNFSVDRFYHGL